MKLSVIVPVYNTENYIEQCLDSLMNQTYKDFELIIIDDGSEDRSGEICDKYALKYKNINVTHKENEGLIAARIEGINKAVGQYIAFVDSDDWVDEDFIEFLITNMESKQADIVVTGIIREEKTKSETVINKISSGTYERQDLEKQIFPKMLYFQGFYEFGILPYMCVKIFKKEILINCYKGIDTDIYWGEDVIIVYPYLLQANKAVICEETKYHYRRHSQSMTAERKKDFYANTARLYLYLYKVFQKTEFSECMLEQLDQYLRLMVWNKSPKHFIEADRNIFPFGKVTKGANIVLYAAGDVGRRYYNHIKRTKYCNIVAWIDSKYDSAELRALGIESVDVITERKFDYLVIAIENSDIANQVRDMLVKMGVEVSKIIQNEEA